jgi:peptidoglycan/LPS O-acetylase OafA/YrhL
MNRERIAALDCLRAGCALMVMAGHLYTESDVPQVPVIGALVSFGVEAVMGFFVLSGYLLATQHYTSVGRYLRARLVRILPLYYLTTAFCVGALLVLGVKLKVSSLLVNAFLMQSLRWLPLFPLDLFGQSWSLSYEVWFYVLFIAILAVPRLLMPMFAASLLTGLSLYVLPQAPGPGAALVHFFAFFSTWLCGVLVAGLHRRGWRVSISTGVFLFAVGLCLGRVPFSEPAKFDFARLFGFGAGFAFLMWSLLPSTAPSQPQSERREVSLGLLARCAIAAVTLAILWKWSPAFTSTKIGFCVLVAVAAVVPGAVESAVSAAVRPAVPFLVYVAGLSYALYLIHYPLLQFFNGLAIVAPVAKVAIVIVLSFAAAHVMDYRLQPWIRALLLQPPRKASAIKADT